MTNKLRSVIDELHYNSTTMTVDPDSQQVVYYEDAVKAVLKTLDAIIEEMERSKCIHTSITETHSMYPVDYHNGCIEELNRQIGSLKQARAELSTSLTQ